MEDPAPIEPPPREYEQLPDRYAPRQHEPLAAPVQEHRSLWQRLGGAVVAAGFLLLKFGKLLLIALKGGKFAGTALSMIISIGAYTLLYGWPFAVGIVLLIFVHEMGHVIQLRREGMDASAPMFIPFFGAFVAMRDMPRNALVEARVGLAGPILGSVGALAVYGASVEFNSPFLRDLAFVGFFLNLFNLLPISPLDGGRAMAAVSPTAWIIGVIAITGLFVLSPNPILAIIALLAIFESWKRWRHRNDDDAYYRTVTPRQRTMVFLSYLALVGFLGVMMDITHVPRSL